jgi:hypothetical protein
VTSFWDPHPRWNDCGADCAEGKFRDSCHVCIRGGHANPTLPSLWGASCGPPSPCAAGSDLDSYCGGLCVDGGRGNVEAWEACKDACPRADQGMDTCHVCVTGGAESSTNVWNACLSAENTVAVSGGDVLGDREEGCCNATQVRVRPRALTAGSIEICVDLMSPPTTGDPGGLAVRGHRGNGGGNGRGNGGGNGGNGGGEEEEVVVEVVVDPTCVIAYVPFGDVNHSSTHPYGRFYYHCPAPWGTPEQAPDAAWSVSRFATPAEAPARGEGAYFTICRTHVIADLIGAYTTGSNTLRFTVEVQDADPAQGHCDLAAEILPADPRQVSAPYLRRTDVTVHLDAEEVEASLLFEPRTNSLPVEPECAIEVRNSYSAPGIRLAPAPAEDPPRRC